ncbi:MAG: sulfurtransferase TusA family protein [Rhodospirillales bacterium]|nr:sulfurtransferase TusA family protein [Rhodospirillales bacterium]
MKAQYFLDITGEVCPMTFVKTKLQIEKIGAGDVLEVRLKGEEPLKNVPRSVLELGHEILEKITEPGEDTYGIHRLIIRKTR